LEGWVVLAILAGLAVQRMTRGEDGPVVAGMALRGADIADAAVAMVDVVPMHKAGRPVWGVCTEALRDGPSDFTFLGVGRN
jgi:hypothetical protein